MAALDSIYSGFDINKNLNDSYTGPLFRIWSFDSGSSVFIDVEQDANGEPDLTALQNEASWNATHDWAYYGAFSPWGNNDWLILPNDSRTNFSWDTNRWNKFWDSVSQTFSKDANGKLIIPKVSNGINEVISCTIPTSLGPATESNLPLGQYSIFVRQEIVSPTPNPIRGLVGFKDNVAGSALRAFENDTGTTEVNMGSPTYYKDGVLQNLANNGEAWTAFANQPLNVAGIVNFDSAIDRTVAEPFYVFNAFDGFAWQHEYFTSILMYSGDVGTSVDDTQVTEIQTLIEGVYDPILTPSVTFTDEVGSPIVGGHVLWIEETAFTAASPSWNSPVIVSSTGVTDANGVVTYTGTVDETKVYTAVLRDYNYVNGAWVKAQGSDSGQQNVDLTAPV